VSNKYFAYHVDLRGVSVASYELRATEDDAAVSEARHLLRLHSSLEIWQGARFVVRLAAGAADSRSAGGPVSPRHEPDEHIQSRRRPPRA
jgi:hypothetical protein